MSKRQRKAQRKRRNSAFKLRGLVGMFDSSNRDGKLSEIGDPQWALMSELTPGEEPGRRARRAA
jgi:hypothetical protein